MNWWIWRPARRTASIWYRRQSSREDRYGYFGKHSPFTGEKDPAKEISVREAVKASLDQIDRQEPKIHAFLDVDEKKYTHG